MTDNALDEIRRRVIAKAEATGFLSVEDIDDVFAAVSPPSPSQVAPANPAQVTDALKSAEKALRPYYNAVFNDNGDIEVDGPYDYDEAVAGYFAYKKIERAIAAIGACGQAVAVKPLEWKRNNNGSWGATTPWHDTYTVEKDGDQWVCRNINGYYSAGSYAIVIEMLDRDYERRILSALSQPHPADERVVEALRHFRTWFADHFENFDDVTNMQLLCLDNEAAAALSVKEGR